MKHITRKLGLLLVMISLFVTGCASKEDAQNAQDMKEDFIQVYFTSDYNQRYTNLMSNGVDLVEESETYYEAYYSDISSLVTQECLNTLIANREPIKYDKQAADNGESITVADVTFEEYNSENGVYLFTVTLEADNGSSTSTYDVTGQITVEKEADQEKVSHIFIQ